MRDETKEQALARIKEQMSWLGWDDAKCLEFYESNFNSQQSISTEETVTVYYAYYIENENTGRRKYGNMSEEEFDKKQLAVKSTDYKRCFNERTVKETIQEWKDEVRHETNWDRYMNR